MRRANQEDVSILAGSIILLLVVAVCWSLSIKKDAVSSSFKQDSFNKSDLFVIFIE